ncbi:hypothetical protein WDU94_002542 [Cyamophila willieti]
MNQYLVQVLTLLFIVVMVKGAADDMKQAKELKEIFCDTSCNLVSPFWKILSIVEMVGIISMVIGSVYYLKQKQII